MDDVGTTYIVVYVTERNAL